MNNDIILEKVIGNGSFGDVYIGLNKKTGQKVAVKRCKKKILYQYGTYLITAFWKEIDSMKKCECENSVKLISNFETTNNQNIIMELCDTDLYNHFKKCDRPFSVDEIRDIFSQLNNVFKLMYDNNIVHRDLKLANILIKYTDEKKEKFIPKLSDYGFSKGLNHKLTGTHLGTPMTMAPEIMMDKPYNEKSDLWSIGIMMYQLHFKEVPYTGFNEKQILYKIQTKCPRKSPADPLFCDLINKLLVVDPDRRIGWNDYFDHPFFQQKKVEKYTKIKTIDTGLNVSNDIYECYIAKDNSTGKDVLIKSYNNEFFAKREDIFSEELRLFKCFSGNPCVMKILYYEIKNGRRMLIFEYNNLELLHNFTKEKAMNEKELKQFTKDLFNNVFIFNECNCLPFIFISKYSFAFNSNGKPIVFDFGIHSLFLSNIEYNSYFINKETSKNNMDRIKINVMNYGLMLLQLLYGKNIKLSGKEIILPQDIILSEEFNKFISKCVQRKINLRQTWLKLYSEDFLTENSTPTNIINHQLLINDKKLTNIIESLKEKFIMFNNYYPTLISKNNDNYINIIESFIFIMLFEMKIVLNFFNRNEQSKPFNSQNEISFLSINKKGEVNQLNLNFANPLLKDIKIIDFSKNKNVKDLVNILPNEIKKTQLLLKNIHSRNKNSILSGNLPDFLRNLFIGFKDLNVQEYFFELIKKADNENDNEKKLKDLYISEYLCQFILFIKNYIFEPEDKVEFTKDEILEKFHKIFGDKNSIYVTTFAEIESKDESILVSFLPILFKFFQKNEVLSNEKLKENLQSINGATQYYTYLMEKISFVTKEINKK